MGANSQIQLKTTAMAGTSVVTTPQVRAELVAQAPEGVAPGRPLQLGLLLTHTKDWHTYWKNPGDSGLPTQLEWQLPAGLDAGEIAWPVPKKISIGHLANYGYEGTALLPVPVTVSPAFNPGPLAQEVTIRLKASWLVCRQECIPEDGEFTLQLPIQGTTALHAAAFDAAAQAHPQDLPAHADSGARVDGGAVLLRVAGLPAALQGQKLEVFPETSGVVETAATPTQQWDGATWTARVPLARDRSEGPEPMPLVLAHAGQGWRMELPVAGGWPAVAPLAAMSPALEAALKANAANAQPLPQAHTPAPLATWLLALAGAVLGGLILNLMPCVFPVLAIKVVGFARHAQDARAHRVSGLAYTAGVLLSFLALGALMLALRAAGEAVGWGFQLQSPAVVAALAALFTLIALNLAGMYEFRAHAAVIAGRPAGAPPGAGRLPDRRARRGRGLAVHGAVHGRVARPHGHAAGCAGAVHLRRAGPGPGPALSAGQLAAGLCPRPAPARRLDGDTAPLPGLSHVRHRGLAGLGAGPAKRYPRRGRAAGAAGAARHGRLGADVARPQPGRACSTIHSCLRLVHMGLGPKNH